MKKSRTKTLVGLALTCLALAGASSLYAATTYIISTFDSDLSSLTNPPYGTNFWYSTTNVYGGFTPLSNTNAGNPGGAMLCELIWGTTTGNWQWQNQQVQVNPWGTNYLASGDGLDLTKYDYATFDVAVNIAASMTNDNAGADLYGGIQVIAQGWPGWGNNATSVSALINWDNMGTVVLPTTNGWYHVQVPTTSFNDSSGSTMSKFVLGFYLNNSIPLARILTNNVLVDNVEFVSLGKPPKMTYANAARGLHIFTTGGQYDRDYFVTGTSGGSYLWSGLTINGSYPVTYTFTLASFPPLPAATNYDFRLVLDSAAASTQVAPDWTDPNVVMMDLYCDTNGIATWMFRYKTNAANDNGNLYQANAQISITNPTPVGKWTLTFNTDTNVTMTGPNGVSGNWTNFTMGIHTNVPDISAEFAGTGGTVFFGPYITSSGYSGLDTIVTAAQLYGGVGLITSNGGNWLVETVLDTNVWAPNNPPYWLVPTNNAKWLSWTLPDGGFGLQTNGASIGNSTLWSTNHGLPAASTEIPNQKTLLIKPGDLPNTKNLLFRLSNPPY
jgi:hypothetical protein